jgi:spore coat polysaccharide biosynthesis protein SpsF (cytidylyltransferase family)
MIEDTKQHLGKDYLSIKTEDWHLMKAFKEACEEMGWQYNSGFTKFSQERFVEWIDNNGCMYFSYDFEDMEGKPAFALSSSQLPAYLLPQDWKQALRAAKAMLDQHRYMFSVELNEDYTAVVDIKKRTVRVGCQEFSMDKVLQIVDIFKKQKQYAC